MRSKVSSLVGGVMNRYPYLNDIKESRENTTYFLGYQHKLSAQDGAFFDMKNITADKYPIMATRHKRGFVKQYENVQGILDKEELVIVANGRLYINDTDKGIQLTTEGDKAIAKMGAYIVIMPDKVWYNVETDEHGNMEASYEANTSVSFTLCGADGKAITWHDSDYYKSHTASEGDYMMSTVNGKTSLKVYSSGTGLWSSVATTYIKVAASGIGNNFEKEDGVKISVDLNGITWDRAQYIFVNEDGTKRDSNFVIFDKGDDYITIPGLLDANKTFTTTISVGRNVPDISFMTECQNRLWGCSADGHEVYCCKLGDVKNWNCFAGISTDSWAATVGTDGKFTGAFSYLGYPLFFKEDSLIRITISSQGAHQTRDIACRGVQSGSERSLCMVNELLYYKSGTAVCTYDGQFPSTISDSLGDVTYKNAVAGVLGSKYYISMESDEGYSLFTYDSAKKIWCKEDATRVKAFCKHKDELYYIAEDDSLNLVYGDTEGDFDWMAETAPIGFSTPDKKNLSRVNVRIKLENKSVASLEVQYDSYGPWINVWQIYGKGTQTFTIPMRPHRCDHLRLRLKGRGAMEVYSITKSLVSGSDI